MSTRQSIRGMHDILPDESGAWRQLEAKLARLFDRYQFKEIRLPLLEHTEVFTRAIGQSTDVVEKEMYTFADRNGDSLSLRPEGTAAVVRSVIQHGLLNPPGLKVWYQGPMFRHERPQRGRQRQFHQFGAEVFGWEDPSVDAELIAMVERLWRELGVADNIRLEINSLGDPEDRQRHRQQLLDYLTPFEAQLDADSQRRLHTNPLRIFDSKVPQTQEIMVNAPKFESSLGDQARAHFDALKAMLDALGIRYTVNPGLVRGLDYYCRTVFEWITDDLGAQGTVCAGGRYDGLVAMAGGKDVPGIGFAMGAERLLELIKIQGGIEDVAPAVYWVGGVERDELMMAAEALRDALPDLPVGVDLPGGSFKSQLKRADRSGARWALIVGQAESEAGTVLVKDLRSDQPQRHLPKADLAQYLATELLSDKE
ncbi:MAG: histidine--tRNA ligase [Wenzhouxiangella sp.]|nr:histidine--tRNA ligase [Wenzhouxiangella sp.]